MEKYIYIENKQFAIEFLFCKIIMLSNETIQTWNHNIDTLDNDFDRCRKNLRPRGSKEQVTWDFVDNIPYKSTVNGD